MAGTDPHGLRSRDRQTRWDRAQTEAWIALTSPHVVRFVRDLEAVFATVGVTQELRMELRDRLVD